MRLGIGRIKTQILLQTFVILCVCKDYEKINIVVGNGHGFVTSRGTTQ